MDAARFRRLEQAFAAASELPPDARRTLLLALRAESPELAAELERLLADHDARTDSLLAAGAVLRRDLAGDGAPADDPPPAAVGRFRIVGEIARGGIGRILRAEDPTIGRQVAVKVLRPEFERQELARRMLADEGRLGGRLQHPSIVPVYEIGTAGDQPYLAMRIVDGRDFAAMLAARRDPRDNRTRVLAVFEQVCHAIAYAHGCGVVHRDLKPNNVMVGAFGEVQVMDWGIALQLEGHGVAGVAADGPAAHAVSGTPAYMAPEQARGDRAHTDRRTDVFGLGAILCEILTGAPPYGDGSATEVLARARQADQAAARRCLLATGDDHELVRLALDCLAPDPAARPADAAAVAAAVHDHLASVADRLRRAELDARAATARAAGERKVRRLIAVLAVVVVLVAVGGAYAWIRTADAAQQRASTADQRVTSALFDAERRFAVADAGSADDLAAWDAALQAARSAAAMVDADVAPVLARRATELLRQTEGFDRDLRFVTDLVTASSEASCTNRFDRRPMALQLRRCVEDRLGGATDTIDAGAAAKSLATIRWRERLVIALDAWTRLELEGDRGSTVARWVRTVADRLDDDGWRRQVRAACGDADLDALRRLAADPAAATAAASTLRHLALGLMTVNDIATGIAVLQRSVARHPDDFDSLLDLAWLLLGEPGFSDVEQAQRYVQATLAARPQHPAALELQAQVLQRRGELVPALAILDDVVARVPEEPTYRRSRALLRKDAGDLDGAAADFAWTLAHLEESHAGWPAVMMEATAVDVRRHHLDDAWQRYLRALASPTMSGAYLVSVAADLDDADLAAFARAHTADTTMAWAAWLLLGLSLRERATAEALHAFERVADAPTWATRLAARLSVELTERLGGTTSTAGSAQQAVDALPPGIDLAEGRQRLAAALAALRAAGNTAAAEHLEGHLCERARRNDAALPHYRAAIAADRDAIESWLRLHACRSAVDGDEAADAEIRALLAERLPGPVLRLPLRRVGLRAEPTPAGREFALAWTLQPRLDERRKPFAVHVRVRDDADAEPRHAAIELWVPAESGHIDAPPGSLVAGHRYTARVRLLCEDAAAPGPWSDAVAVLPATQCEAVPIDLSPWARADAVADPGDSNNDAFDPKNGFCLLVDGFDGKSDGIATAQGLPRDRHLGPFLLGAYDQPQTLRLHMHPSAPLRVDLPPDHYVGVHLLVASANGNATVPIAIRYDGDGGEVREQLFLADWFNGSAPPDLDLLHIGMPVVRGMDRLGPTGFEERNAAALFDRFVPLDPARVARSLVFLLDRASGEQQGTVANVLAITAMRPAATARDR